jgi:hypothetical protein
VTDALTVAVASVAIGVSAAAAWLHWPRPPAMEAERWFKSILATLWRGRVEAEGGGADSWERAVIRFVPWHPAGRSPEVKVAAAAYGSGAPVEGERALVDALAALPPGQARWDYLYREDQRGVAARLADPRSLGPFYDPARTLGPGASWDELAGWAAGDPRFGEAIHRRCPARWALIGEAPVLDALARVLGPRAERVDLASRPLASVAPAAADRFVVIAAGPWAVDALKALYEGPELRDRLIALVAIGGRLRGPEVDDWMGAHFGHDPLDTERHRTTPYAAIQWFDPEVLPPGVTGAPLESMRFPEPGGSPGPSAIAAIDLGPLPVDPELPLDLVARAVVAWVACDALTRGSG